MAITIFATISFTKTNKHDKFAVLKVIIMDVYVPVSVYSNISMKLPYWQALPSFAETNANAIHENVRI